MPFLSDLVGAITAGMRNSGAALGLLQPIAMTRATHSPVYAYSSDSPEAGYNAQKVDAIFLNRRYENDPEAWPAIVKHESTHQVLKPYMNGLAKDTTLAQYVDSIKRGLVNEKNPVYRDVSPGVAMSEALAYGTYDPHMPGLDPQQTRDLFQRALSVLDTKGKAGKQIRQLYGPRLSDLAAPQLADDLSRPR